ncbi:MAG: YceI family protein [Bacteroidetes bacterium]|nr:YceI family protein [Bacteroidota bacterium]
MKTICILIIYCLSVISIANAQAPFMGMLKTKSGHVVINGKIDTTTITGQSNSLLIILNCATSEITAIVDINTISTGIGRYDSLLVRRTDAAYFKGKMEINLLNTDLIPPFDFEIDGILTLNSMSRPMKMRAGLNYLPDQEISGLLSGSLAISLNDFNLKNRMPGFSDLLTIQFTQVILKKVCE